MARKMRQFESDYHALCAEQADGLSVVAALLSFVRGGVMLQDEVENRIRDDLVQLREERGYTPDELQAALIHHEPILATGEGLVTTDE